MCTRPAARHTSLIIGMELTIESCVQGQHFSKELCTPKVGEELACIFVCQHEESHPNHMYTVAVRTNAMKTVQIKCHDLSSFQLHFIINFVLTEPKLAYGPVKFPACSISRFVMNIMAKTDSTVKMNSAKSHFFINAPKYLQKFLTIRYVCNASGM